MPRRSGPWPGRKIPSSNGDLPVVAIYVLQSSAPPAWRTFSIRESKCGFVPLPLIKNSKTVDPRDKNSPPVFQLETSMGAATECFEGAGAIVVPRSRFAPVKTTSDLLALRSDAYVVTPHWSI